MPSVFFRDGHARITIALRGSGTSIWRRSASGSATGGPAGASRRLAAGRERTSIDVAALVDTNVLVYRFDPRLPAPSA